MATDYRIHPSGSLLRNGAPEPNWRLRRRSSKLDGLPTTRSPRYYLRPGAITHRFSDRSCGLQSARAADEICMRRSNTRFALAVHLLAYLELHGGGPIGSDKIAVSANTAPNYIRGIMRLLAKAGLTKAREGEHGGAI